MQKLLRKWLAEPNMENARKLVAYNNKHMMAACMLLPCEVQLLNDAIKYVQTGV
jgi:hypothetical protein